MFTDIKSLIAERKSQTHFQRRKMLKRLKHFDDRSEDNELNLEKQNTMNLRRRKRKKFRSIP